MNKCIEEIKDRLHEAGLKVTPQRLAIMEAVHTLKGHPTAEMIIGYIRRQHPGIATGTVYKVLEALAQKGLVQKVKTDRDVMRYDGVTEPHHHLYCSSTNRIEDYFDEELDRLLEKYFKEKNIKDFDIEEIKLQINGQFRKSNTKKNK